MNHNILKDLRKSEDNLLIKELPQIRQIVVFHFTRNKIIFVIGENCNKFSGPSIF